MQKFVLILCILIVGCAKVPLPTQPEQRENTTPNPLAVQEYEPPIPEKEPFNITIKGLEPYHMATYGLFARAAADKWEKIIVEGLPDVGEIDDVVIEFQWGGTVKNYLASARPSLQHLRHGSGLPCYGVITLYDPIDGYINNYADLKNSDITKIIFHEMGHILGFDLWTLTYGGQGDKIESINGAQYFTGGTAIDAYREALYQQGEKLAYAIPDLRLPIEPDAFHWRYPALKWDVMAPFFHTDNVVTKVTICALDDMGYTVDLSQAEDPKPSRLTKPAIGRPIFRCDDNAIYGVEP